MKVFYLLLVTAFAGKERPLIKANAKPVVPIKIINIDGHLIKDQV
jgi:hypothetical protein